MAGNPFDQFDAPAAPAAGANPFDQFDAPPAAPQQTFADGVQAATSGFNSGVADLAGSVVDTGRNIKELGKAAMGVTYHELTGNPIPEALQPEDQDNYKNDVFSSDWIKQQARNVGRSDLVDAQEGTTFDKYLHAAGEGVAPGIIGGPANAVRAGVAGAASGVAQQGASDLGGSPLAQAAVGVLAGHVAGNLGLRSTTTLTPKSVASPPTNPTGGYTPEGIAAARAAKEAAATKPTPDPNAAPATPPAAGAPPPAAPPAAPVVHQPSGPVDIHSPTGQPFAVLSAERPERTPEENAAHTQQLGNQLKASGLPFQPTSGAYEGTAEPSYAVQTPTDGAKAQVNAFAAQHEQKSVLHVDSDRNAAYQYDDGHTEQLGKWTSVSPETAQAQPGFTQDAAGQHYITQPAPAPKPLEGLPQTPVNIPHYGTVTPGPSEAVRQVARNYMAGSGLPYNPPTDFRAVVPEKMAKIADAYDRTVPDPTLPGVQASYDALNKETMAQYQAIKAAGLKVNFIKPSQADPYESSPRLAVEDIRNNNHMWVYPTDAGFGPTSDPQPPATAAGVKSDHPMLQPSGEMIDGKPATNNDIFRIVHDYFGHAAEGNGFRADGEYNAWRLHNAMYSDAAKPALASETLGQNAWVNFGPNGEFNRHASARNTIYADQKPGIMPGEPWKDEGGGFEPASGGVPKGSAFAASTPQGPTKTPADWVSGPPDLSNMVSFKKPADEGSASGEVSPQEQIQRESTLRALGTLKETRQSAITGDTKRAGTDFQTSRVDDPQGRRMSGVIGGERAALKEGANNLVAMSGGSDGMENGDLYRRGSTITAPIDGYHQHLDDAIQSNYETANQRLGTTPIQALNEFQNYLKENKAEFISSTEGEHLLNGINEKMKTLGFKGANDTFNPPTVKQTEALRQFLSDAWTPRTGRLVSGAKQGLDNDVAKAAGEDVYAKARLVNTLRNKMLDEPKAVSKLLSPDDRLGINRDVPLEKIPGYVTHLPVDQFGHLVNVLTQVGDPGNGPATLLNRQGTASLNEIRAQFMNEYRAAGLKTDGMWDAKGSNNYLMNNQAKLAMVFTPEQLRQIGVHNDSAAYLRMDRSYPGAAAQHLNLAARGTIGAIKHGGAIAGAALGEIPGAIAGAAVGQAAGGIENAILKRSVEHHIVDLTKPQRVPTTVARGKPVEPLTLLHPGSAVEQLANLDPNLTNKQQE
jgi:hypothetical protein